ncbi:MAG: GPR endopeptidase, partial [Firmicutes bacterium]|nr:GPR endopeptidase [Bacillota bacterium]
MQYRTDLAVEVDALLAEAQQRAQGYIKKQCQIDEDIAVTDITITTEDGEAAFGKPRGTYITLEVQGVLEEKNDIIRRASKALAEELKKMIK